MAYGITQLYSGQRPFLELTGDEYTEITSARRRMYDLLYIQEKYAYLIENYYELESELLASDFREMNAPDVTLDETLDSIHLFIRRLTNLLTTARLYLDHTKQDIKSVAGPDDSISEHGNRILILDKAEEKLFQDFGGEAGAVAFAADVVFYGSVRRQDGHCQSPQHG